GHHGDHAYSGDHAHHGDHAHSGGSDMAQAMAQTPDWATAVNWVAIALSALAAVWWLLLLVRSRRIGIHTLCHAVMGLGMAGMLALMSAPQATATTTPAAMSRTKYPQAWRISGIFGTRRRRNTMIGSPPMSRAAAANRSSEPTIPAASIEAGVRIVTSTAGDMITKVSGFA